MVTIDTKVKNEELVLEKELDLLPDFKFWKKNWENYDTTPNSIDATILDKGDSLLYLEKEKNQKFRRLFIGFNKGKYKIKNKKGEVLILKYNKGMITKKQNKKKEDIFKITPFIPDGVYKIKFIKDNIYRIGGLITAGYLKDIINIERAGSLKDLVKKNGE